ncbi:hypothetical protein OF83DRAFT_1094493 [Amylostereum chailletii]|nr:hypothetical protein OF83DRAFT_1094493 [Amylostereum chailletii]
MNLPELAALSLNDPGPDPPPIEDDINNASGDRYLLKLKSFARALPYSIESNAKMQSLLNFICKRIIQAVEAKDYDPGFLQWDSMLTYWSYLRYPIPKEKRIQMVKLYFYLSVTPGMPLHVVATCADALDTLTRSKNKLSVDDLRLPWTPIMNILQQDLFLTRRQFEVSQTSYYMGYIAGTVRRFFHPAAVDEMLSVFVPMLNGTALDDILAPQYYMLTFLPQSHPQFYLPMLTRLWESVNSYLFDDRMLQFMSKLAEMHVNPAISDPKKLSAIPDDARTEDEGRPNWRKDDIEDKSPWTGIYSDVGIFSEHNWNIIMCKCLASMEIPLADSGSLTTGPSADNQAGFEISRLPKPTWRIFSLARIIVYSMAPDSVPNAPSSAPSPFLTPLASGMNTPRLSNGSMTGSVGDYLTARLGKPSTHGLPFKTYAGGSKALDSLVKLIASTESFFHPSNSGAWTADLSAFIKYVAYEFNKRWHEEQKPDCKTPKHRRLTPAMKRELVHCLRTVALIAMFSEDSTTVSNISSCLKWMSLMEPDLILYPILERAVPALETLTETQRTIAVIKALGAVAPALVSREVFYPGAKHLVPILQLLIPGIDLNDPSKTLCTTTFLLEISQYIKFGDLTVSGSTMSADVDIKSQVSPDFPSNHDVETDESPDLPSLSIGPNGDPLLSPEQEDEVLRQATGGFPDWIASFIRRVILLFDNLPEEAGGSTEVQMVDAVTNACSQICIHLSDPLFDLVLGMVFDYASNNIRPNAVRAVHQLVECVANANPEKTLAKFLPLCLKNIYVELESGASSVRTTSSHSTPMPADATFHWNLAILRGAVFNDGRAVAKYRFDFIRLLQLLRQKTCAQRGYSWSGKLLSSLLLTLTHTYPLEDKFMNPGEWSDDEFRSNHHKYWGKLYTAEDVTVSWHVPSGEEIGFALQIFKDIVEPALQDLEKLLAPGVARGSIWRNDFCRYLSFVRSAFVGTPTMVKEVVTKKDQEYVVASSDIINEIPEMIASIEPLNAGFAILDPQDSRALYYTSLRSRFGKFLHEASVSLRQQGEENTVDAVSMLIQSIKTYMLDYGDSKDGYYMLLDRYGSELSYARQHTSQKAWPRSVFIRRARLYNAARLRWNSIERKRGPLEDLLVDDVAEWAMWNYATVRESSQSVLDSLSASYDGVRRRCLPAIYKNLEPGTEDDRMKGALWTLNSNTFVKYAMAEFTLAPGLLSKIFGCQANEKPSIQSCVSSVSENGINSFVEPNFLVYDTQSALLDSVISDFKACIPFGDEDQQLVSKCAEQRVRRVRLWDEGSKHSLSTVLAAANSESTHWKYAIFAARCLRTLVRKDVPTSSSHIRYFLEKAHDNHPSLRYYSQRAIMKIMRFIKLRTFSQGPVDLIMEKNNNPMKKKLRIDNPSSKWTQEFLYNFRKPLDPITAGDEAVIIDNISTGWVAWRECITAYRFPHPTKPSLKPWDSECEEAIAAVREVALDPKFWKELSVHFSAENLADTVTTDNISCVKSIVQVLEDESFKPLQDLIEDLIADADQNKQRGAAEFLAGLLNGAKHWPVNTQTRLWDWAMPLLMKTLSQKIKTDTLPIWTSFIEYIFSNKDPRRFQEFVDYILKEFHATDYNGESSLHAVTALSFVRALYEEESWKFTAWADEAVERVWAEMACEHDEVHRVHFPRMFWLI